jgi:hypothetical protein
MCYASVLRQAEFTGSTYQRIEIMKAKVVYESANEADVFMTDGGVATFHHNGEHMLTTYYQDRVVVEMLGEDEDLWEKLAEGKAYIKDWPEKQEVDDGMIKDAVSWLCMDCEVLIKKFNQL